MNWAEFQTDDLKQDGVVRQLTIIGEASRRLSAETRQAHMHIQWSKIVGMRNRIVHDYLEVDIPTVWQTVQDDLPVLKKQLEELVNQGIDA